MPVRPEVRDTQRTLAALDAAHRRAVALLDQAVGRRAEVLAEHERHVADAEAAVEAAVAEMADQVSVGLTAQILGLDVATIRRCVKSQRDHRRPPRGGDQ